MKECPKCKAMMEDDALFCGECGTKFDIADTEPHAGEDPIIEEKYCIHCGKAMEADSLYCPHCGKPQEVEEAKPEAPKEQKNEEGPQQDDEPTYELEKEKKSKKWLWVLLVIACLGAGAWFYFGSGMFEQSSEIEMEEDSELQKHLEEEQQKMEMMSFVKDFYSHYKEDGYIYDNVSERVLKKLRRDYPYECYEGDCLATWVFAAYPEGADMDFEVGPIITQTGSGIFNITFRYSYMNNGEKKYEDRSIRLYVGKVDGQYKITNYTYEDKSQAPRNDEEKRITEIPEGEYHLWCADMHMTLVVYDKIVEGEYYFQAGSTMSTSIKLNGRADNGLKLHLSQTSKVNGEDKGYMDGIFDGKTFKGEYDKDGYRHDFEIYVGGE